MGISRLERTKQKQVSIKRWWMEHKKQVLVTAGVCATAAVGGFLLVKNKDALLPITQAVKTSVQNLISNDPTSEKSRITFKFPTCDVCGRKMTRFDGWAWFTCPSCGNAVRDNDDGTWTWQREIFGAVTKEHHTDFELADFCRGGDLTEG